MANEFLTAGIKFSINSTLIAGCKAIPAMGSTPSRKDITSFDNLRMKTYKNGLIELGDLNFEFWCQGDNENKARAEEGKTNEYKVEYPDGSADTWNGTHRTYKSSAAVDDVLAFTIAVTAESEMEHTDATVITG